MRSAGTLATADQSVIADINALADTLTASETADAARVRLAYKSAVASLRVPYVATPALTAAATAAARLVPVKNPVAAGRGAGPGGGRGGGAAAAPPALGAPPAPATLTGYYTMEANNFADGTRSILDIRNAIPRSSDRCRSRTSSTISRAWNVKVRGR